MNICNSAAGAISSAEPRNNRGDEWLTFRTYALLLAAALLFIFPKLALGLSTFFYRDAGALGYPLGFYLRECLLRGELPVWNPYSHCGVPFLAQWGTCYPVAFLGGFLPLPWFFNAYILAHLLWGGVGMFWLLRRWNLSPFAAAFAATAFVFNGVTMSCLVFGNYIASLSWLPWLFGSVMSAWQYGGRWLAVAAIVSTLQVLTATPELTLLAWCFLGVVWVVEVVSRQVGFLTSALRVASVVGLAAGLSMVQMLPFFDLLAHSQRDRNYASTVWSIPGWGWANLLVPLFHAYRAPQGTWFQTGQEFIPSYYLGAGVLLLGITGVWLVRSRRNLAIGGMILLCWTLGLGSNTIIFGWVKTVFPLIGIARFPVKFAILPAFLLPLLVAYAVERLQTSKEGRRPLLVLASIALFLVAFLLWFAHRYPFPDDQWKATAFNGLVRVVIMLGILFGIHWLPRCRTAPLHMTLQVVIMAFLPIDALNHSPNIAPTLPSAVLQPGMWQANGNPPLKVGQARIMISPEAEQRLIYSRIENLQIDFLVKRVAEWYNINLLDDLPKVTGAMTLRPAAFDVLERYIYYTPGSHCGQGLLDFLSVAFISSSTNQIEWLTRTNFLPVITAGQRPVFADDAQTLQAVTADTFDPRETVYLPATAKASMSVTNRSSCSLHAPQFSSGKVEVGIEASSPALLVLSQSFYHHWRAFVDEHEVPLFRANLAFQALPVPVGNHRVKLVYEDPQLFWGALLSLVSLVLCGLVCLRPTALRAQG